MKVHLLQTDIFWCSPQQNRKKVEVIIASLNFDDSEQHLLVLPEMFTTGFVTTPEQIAEERGETLDWLKDVSREYGSAIAGSVAVKEKGRYYNRLYFVKPDGATFTYDKRHLFSFGGEDQHYTAGSERKIVEWGGVRIFLQICYDLRFPVFSRNNDDYDMLLYVANWPVQRINVWNTLLKARAIENAAYVVGVNRSGTDPQNSYPGHSQFIDYKGDILAVCDEGQSVAEVSVDTDSLVSFRKKFPVLKDADKFALEL